MAPFERPKSPSEMLNPVSDKLKPALAKSKSTIHATATDKKTIAKQLGLIKMAARIQFAAQKNMGKTPMVFHDPHQLELRVHAAAMKAGFVGPAVRKLTQAKAEQQLSLICPAVQHQRAMMESHGAKTPGHFIRLALEMYLPEVRPGLHFRHEPIAEEEHWARENEKRLSRSARYKEFRPYVLVAEPRSGSPEETKWQKQERTGSPF